MFSRLHPIHESVRAARELRSADPDSNVLAHLDDLAELVVAAVPECVGMSVAWLDLGISFTLVASDVETATLDAVQYLDGGPCVDGADAEEPLETRAGSPVDEERWQLFSRAAAARGVASTLTLPLVEPTVGVVGTVNLYAATADAFEGRHDLLAAIVGGDAAGAVRNADLSFTTVEASRRAPARLEAQKVVAQAAGMLAARMDIEVAEAVESMTQAAHRAGVDVEDVARLIVESRGGDPEV